VSNGHPKCYAQALGGCSHTLSGEHYVSKIVLRAVSQADTLVRVRGLKFLPSGVEQEIGISSLTGNVLCKAHNSALSDFDTTGLNFFNSMERVMVPGSPGAPMRVSGDCLEAWILKTMVGGVFCGAFPLPENLNLKDKPPPPGFLRVLFEQGRLPEPCGLYLWHGPEGEKFLIDHHVLGMEVVPGRPADGGENSFICGMLLRVFGIEFYLSVLPLPDPLPGRWRHMIYRPTEIIGPRGDTIFIEWEGIGGDRAVRVGHTS
jgi:hypothetical protein